MQPDIRPNEHLFPFCIVWTPLPIISWLFPIIGHMGIATSRGIIRDFAGNYHVSENYMAFGWPTSYWELSPNKVPGGVSAYDKAIQQASDEYGNHIHNIFCDNCHSHVALALNTMQYDGRTNWNMVNLCVLMLIKGRHVGRNFWGRVENWLKNLSDHKNGYIQSYLP
ncbi:transmembrane protein [Ditylenchus destructor]|uniref:Transmembrane protein n=1 Tax=Ditylenchus destructor TaxID=166010 RepID=A0AAD4NER8_9BILA|nr:transmembrane protein [Ditylenchus destructor]